MLVMLVKDSRIGIVRIGWSAFRACTIAQSISSDYEFERIKKENMYINFIDLLNRVSGSS